MIPNVSCFVQSVFSLMTSSPFEVVQCEAAALLVELTSHPQVLEVTIDYQYILCFRLLEIVLSSFPLRRMRSFEMARKGKHCCPFKKVKIRGSQFLFVPRFEGWYLIAHLHGPGQIFEGSRANSFTAYGTVCCSKTCTVLRVPCKLKDGSVRDPCKFLFVQKFIRTRVKGVL